METTIDARKALVKQTQIRYFLRKALLSQPPVHFRVGKLAPGASTACIHESRHRRNVPEM